MSLKGRDYQFKRQGSRSRGGTTNHAAAQGHLYLS
jgi:hypothetical protein